MELLAASPGIHIDTVNIRRFIVVAVEAQFSQHIQCDQQEAAKPDCQAGAIDKGEYPVSQQTSPGDFQVISEHVFQLAFWRNYIAQSRCLFALLC